MNISNLTDIPKLASERDLLGIEEYKNGLLEFIRYAQTPLTIALQGEWGSGKTSLLNSIRHELCNRDSLFYGVWINTWEYGLMMDEKTTLTNIITGVIAEVINLIAEEDTTETQKLKKKALSFFSKVGKAAVKTSANIATGGAIGDSLDDMFSGENSSASVRELRNELQKTINDFLIKHPEKRGFLFFIDDLDRINPPIAVQILEVLKNIFDLEHCIFVLAIDYDVVVKGLEPKFGKKNMENEREFRSFFEKIIQLPFSMPVNNYEVKDFLIENLQKINYFNGAMTEQQQNLIQEISLLTVGRNPRAIKRLMNAISLVKCISRNKSEKDINNDISEIINFFLFSIQISYPTIYKVLSEFPDFPSWGNAVRIAYQLNNSSEDFEKIASSENILFDEEWENILYHICAKDFYLKSRSTGISRLLNLIREYIDSNNLNIEETILSGLEIASVTSVDSNIIHSVGKTQMKEMDINPSEISPLYYVDNLTNTQMHICLPYTKENYNESPFYFYVGKRSNSDKVSGVIMILKFTTPEKRVEFMNHLEKYGFSIKDRMKSLSAEYSTIYSENIKLKNSSDVIEQKNAIIQILKNCIPTMEKLDTAFREF